MGLSSAVTGALCVLLNLPVQALAPRRLECTTRRRPVVVSGFGLGRPLRFTFSCESYARHFARANGAE